MSLLPYQMNLCCLGPTPPAAGPASGAPAEWGITHGRIGHFRPFQSARSHSTSWPSFWCACRTGPPWANEIWKSQIIIVSIRSVRLFNSRLDFNPRLDAKSLFLPPAMNNSHSCLESCNTPPPTPPAQLQCHCNGLCHCNCLCHCKCHCNITAAMSHLLLSCTVVHPAIDVMSSPSDSHARTLTHASQSCLGSCNTPPLTPPAQLQRHCNRHCNCHCKCQMSLQCHSCNVIPPAQLQCHPPCDQCHPVLRPGPCPMSFAHVQWLPRWHCLSGWLVVPSTIYYSPLLPEHTRARRIGS